MIHISFKTPDSNDTTLVALEELEASGPDVFRLRERDTEREFTVPRSMLRQDADGVFHLDQDLASFGDDLGQERTWLAMEEQVEVSTRWKETGRVRVERTVDHHLVEVPYEVRTQQAEVIRRPVERVLSPGEEVAPRQSEDGSWVIPVVEERVVMKKIRVLKEEVIVRAEEIVQHQTEQVSLRHAKVHVVRDDSDTLL